MSRITWALHDVLMSAFAMAIGFTPLLRGEEKISYFILKGRLRRNLMGFLGLCQSDPILDFIRETYDAVPLKLPDTRVKPLSIFTVVSKRVRYLGTLETLGVVEGWIPPRIDDADLPDVSKKNSQELSCDVLLDLVGPFLSQILALAQLDLDASFTAARGRDLRAQLALNRVKRAFVHPIACASAVEAGRIKLPATFDSDFGRSDSKPLYLIDSVLSAREIVLSVEGSTATEVAAKLEASLAGKVSTDNVNRANSKLAIIGSKRVPFAFTCLELKVGQGGEITGVKVPSNLPSAGATNVSSALSDSHVTIGASNEFITFDE